MLTHGQTNHTNKKKLKGATRARKKTLESSYRAKFITFADSKYTEYRVPCENTVFDKKWSKDKHSQFTYVYICILYTCYIYSIHWAVHRKFLESMERILANIHSMYSFSTYIQTLSQWVFVWRFLAIDELWYIWS